MKAQLSTQKNKAFWLGLITVLATWGLYFICIWPKLFFLTDKGLMGGADNIWADWPTHLAYATRFAYQSPENWFSSHPFYFNHRATHHFVANLISGILIRFGFDFVSALIIPSIITSIFLLISCFPSTFS